ncbi:hypothetical protein, partial [Azospirillum sp. B4]|uniref:hypothetical protein n=1 Tax=Azospirillum sp. B4 TaxID=95605 RepID=UPI0011DD2F3A
MISRLPKGYFQMIVGMKPIVRFIIPTTFLVIGLLFVLSTFWAVVRFGSTVPIFDQWDDFAYTQRLIDGTLRFGDLFTQHAEHRIFFPRLIFLLDYFIADSTNKVNFAANLFIVSCTLFSILAAYRKLESNKAVFLSISAISALILFSLSQRENFLWGFQVQFFGGVSAAAATFVAFGASVERRERRRSAVIYRTLAYVLAFVATYMLSNGILAAFLLIPMAMVLRTGRVVVFTTAAWAVFLAFSYFLNFHPISGHSPYIYSLTHPVEYLRYLSGYLGNLMAGLVDAEPWRGRFAIALGATGLVLTAAALSRTLRGWSEPPARIVLLALILFVLGTAMLTALGRITFGLDQAFSSRYKTPVSAFWVAHICYWVSLCRFRTGGGKAVLVVGTGILALLTFCAISGHLRGWQEGISQSLAHSKARDAILSDVRDEASYHDLFPVDTPILQRVPFMREHHLAMFADADNRLLGQKPEWLEAPSSDKCVGMFDSVEMLSIANGEVSLAATGWAWNLTSQASVKRVIFTDATGKVVGYAGGGWSRPDVQAALPAAGHAKVGWTGFAKIEPGALIKAHGLMPDHRICDIGEKAAPQNHSRFVPLASLGAAIPMSSEPVLSGGWARDGQNAAAGPLSNGDVVYGSWGGADSNVGELRIGPFTPTQPRVAFPIVTGPHAENQVIHLLDAATGAEI